MKELIEFRDLLISQLTNEDYVNNTSESVYKETVSKLSDLFLEIKSYAPILQFRGEYRWLSNFHKCTIEYEGIVYPSVENYYQAMKSDDIDIRKKVSNMSAAESKAYGKTIEPKDWNSKKLEIMRIGLELKFSHEDLKEKLISTGDRIIQEGNNWNDLYWGVDIMTKEGENNLGKLIMNIRDTY